MDTVRTAVCLWCMAEYLSSIEDYLQNCLLTESLSTAAQIKRRHLLDKFYALRIPPNITRKSFWYLLLVFFTARCYAQRGLRCFKDIIIIIYFRTHTTILQGLKSQN